MEVYLIDYSLLMGDSKINWEQIHDCIDDVSIFHSLGFVCFELKSSFEISKKPAVGKTEIAIVADNDVIENSNLYDIGSKNQLGGDLLVAF